ncbi:MAG: HNH endonuclease [Thermoplasmataceae archaeon]
MEGVEIESNCEGESDTSLMGYGREIFRKGNYTCVYCGRNLKDNFLDWMQLTVEHVIPYKQLKAEGNGLENDVRNKRAACAVCNNMRTRANFDEFKELPFEERIEKTLKKKRELIKSRIADFKKFYDECIQ